MRRGNPELQKKMFTLVEQYLSGTHTVEEISKANNILSSKFKYWQGIYYKMHHTRRRNKKSPSCFIEIKPDRITNYKNIEIEYPNGVKLRLSDTTGIDLKSLIHIV